MLTQTIPARSGAHVFLKAGSKLKIINTHGHQVVDTWAFTTNPTISPPEYLSTTQTRTKLLKLSPSVPDILYTNHRAPLFTFLEDTSPGIHDMLFAACDPHRYQQLGVEGFHDSCANNLYVELKKARFDVEKGKDWWPDPLNLFMNVPVAEGWADGKGGKIELREPKSHGKGNGEEYVVLRAERDCLVVMSACPNDLAPTNGWKTVEAHFEVIED